MTLDEMLAKILVFLPRASLGEDNDGQVLIYTDRRVLEDGTLVGLGEF